ncbi:alkaline phosphatase family protein [Deinococcus malanensis]|uniref:alkaline phosphatase family protein n=1 Tax=Deinococcus malanensis TaxID=1706855 RepID=UPI003643D020
MVYLPDYDSTCHTYGPSSDQAADELAAVDLIVGRLLGALPDNGKTLLVLTADHGQVDQSAQGWFPSRSPRSSSVCCSLRWRERSAPPISGLTPAHARGG